MATAIIDPRKVKYPPESLIEALDQTPVTTGGESVAKYLIDPYDLTLERINMMSTAAVEFFVSADGFGEVMKVRADSILPVTAGGVGDLSRQARSDKIHASRTLECLMKTTAGTVTHQWNRWNVTVRKPSIVDKLRNDPMYNLTAEEQQIADALEIEDKLGIGAISRHPYLLDSRSYERFDEIVTIARQMAATGAATSNIVGYTIKVPQEYVYVLLGVWVENTSFAAIVFSDSFLTVDRDNDYDYMRMDLSAMPNFEMVPCYMPFIDQMTISLDTTTACVATTDVGFQYGIRPMTVIDHLRWNIQAKDSIVQKEIDNLVSRHPEIVAGIKAGIL